MPLDNFLVRCRRILRLKHLSYHTEETYLSVIRRYIEFHGGKTHPKDMGVPVSRAVITFTRITSSVPSKSR